MSFSTSAFFLFETLKDSECSDCQECKICKDTKQTNLLTLTLNIHLLKTFRKN